MINKENLKNILKCDVVSINFKKVDGTNRKMICSLKESVLPIMETKEPTKKKTVKESYLQILSFLQEAKDATRKKRDHKMYGWDKEHPSAKQLANRKKKDKRTVARRKANASGRTKKGDKSVELDHKNGNANDNSPKNLRVVSTHTNRSRNNNKWRKA